MSISSADIIEMAVSHAASTGWFDRVNAHEPKNAPGYGVTASVWVQSLRPVERMSGLSTTSALMTLNIRCYSNMLQEPQDTIDSNLVSAVDAVMSNITGDLTLDGLVTEVDLLGMFSEGFNAAAGYVTIDNTLYRIMTITVPCVVADAWTQAP